MSFSIIFSLLISLLIHLASPAHGAPSAVTVFGVSIPAPTPSEFVSPQSFHIDFTEKYSAIDPTPGSDMTTYVVQEVQSKVVEVDLTASSTTTLLSTPTTFTVTFIEGSTGNVAINTNGASTVSVTPGFTLQFLKATTNCTSDSVITENGRAICVEESEDLINGISTTTINGKAVTTATPVRTDTVTLTYTGVWVPVATLATGSSTGVRASLSAASCALASTICALALYISS